jgi:hypothetical protein
MPNDFPILPYDNVHKRIVARNATTPIPNNLLDHYQGAWNAIAYRFRACAEHSDAFTASIQRVGVANPLEERYNQERDLFGFFLSGLSTLESAAYAFFAIGSILDSSQFPMQTNADLRKVSLRFTGDKYAAFYPTDALTTKLVQLQTSPEFEAWGSLRNILAHRTAPGRHHINSATINFATGAVTNQQTKAEMKGLAVPLDNTTTVTRRSWLSQTLNEVVDAAERFTATHL